MYNSKVSFRNVEQLLVINNENCTEDYSKLKCLNQCFKKKHQLSKYIYNGNESFIIHLDYKYNETIEKDENNCLKNECKENDCKVTHFISKDLSNRNLTKSTSVFNAIFMISRLDFYIQFIGLVCFFGNICLYQLLTILFEFMKPTIKKIKKIKIRKKVIKIKNHD